MSAIWYENEAQLEVINATKVLVAARYGQEIKTPILELDVFYPAEDYHQKYYLQNHNNLMRYFNGMYSKFEGFMNSTAAARLNGFVAGHGTKELLNAEVGGYGIPAEELGLKLSR